MTNLPKECPCCFKKANFTDKIKRGGSEFETDAWFCNFCGGLVIWKTKSQVREEKINKIIND